MKETSFPTLHSTDPLSLRLRRCRPLDVCKSESESSKECGTTKCDTDDQTFPETRYVGFKYSLQELLGNYSLEVGSTSVQDDLGIEARSRDGQLLEKRVLEGSLGGRDTESTTEGLND